MKAASELKPAGSLRPHTYATLIGLLASCGLRPGEAVRLRDADVEMAATPPRLVIRETKFRKSRLVPVDSSTAEALRNYASTRERLGYDGLSETFFVSESGAPLAYSTVGATFLKIVRLGIHGPARSFGPNLRQAERFIGRRIPRPRSRLAKLGVLKCRRHSCPGVGRLTNGFSIRTPEII
jgi:integrase/recombinase XerD